MEKKRCPRCKRILDLSETNFCKNNSTKTGFNDYCKPCSQAKYKQYMATEKGRAAKRKHEREWRKEWRRKYPGREKEIKKKCSMKLRKEMLDAYGSQCTCCGEKEMSFLTIEHINHDGGKHRRKLGNNGGQSVWRDLRKKGWPKNGYTLLCWNCQLATAWGDICPHKQRDAT